MTADYFESLFDRLFPICRSITGDGLRESLQIFAAEMPLTMHSVASGSTVFDWTVPNEWHISRAKLTLPTGKVIADITQNNLHVVNYSVPIDAYFSLGELRPYLHSLPHLPQFIPYVTSYYQPNWGFCLAHEQLTALPEGIYHAQIDSEFRQGEVNFASCLVKGEMPQEVLLSSYLCHPSMANNELSGPLVLLGLYHRIARWKHRRFSYRFALMPETIGSLCYLSQYGEHLKQHCIGGLVLTCLGGSAEKISIKLARDNDCQINKLARRLAAEQPEYWHIREFTPCNGSDERQYCSPGFNLPIAQAARTVYGAFPEYHSSGDTKEFMGIDKLMAAIDQLEMLLQQHEQAGVFMRTNPYGEPQLGKRGLYRNLNAPRTWGHSSDHVADGVQQRMAMQWLLNLADGEHDLIDMANRAHMPLALFTAVAELLVEAELIYYIGHRVSRRCN
ncbi:MAG: DUF4910 domain-containing protein [Aeromonas sp.]